MKSDNKSVGLWCICSYILLKLKGFWKLLQQKPLIKRFFLPRRTYKDIIVMNRYSCKNPSFTATNTKIWWKTAQFFSIQEFAAKFIYVSLRLRFEWLYGYGQSLLLFYLFHIPRLWLHLKNNCYHVITVFFPSSIALKVDRPATSWQ